MSYIGSIFKNTKYIKIARAILTDQSVNSSDNCAYINTGNIWITNKKCVHMTDCRERVLGNIFIQGPPERTGRKCFWPWLKYYCRSEQPISSTTIFTSLTVSILYITPCYGRTSLGTESRILLGVLLNTAHTSLPRAAPPRGNTDQLLPPPPPPPSPLPSPPSPPLPPPSPPLLTAAAAAAGRVTNSVGRSVSTL